MGDFGLSLHAKHSSSVMRYAAGIDSQPLPLLPVLAARASSGKNGCAPPEYCGLENKYIESFLTYFQSVTSQPASQVLGSPQNSLRDPATPTSEKRSLDSSVHSQLNHSTSKSQLS